MVTLYNNGEVNRNAVPLIKKENVAVMGAGNVVHPPQTVVLAMREAKQVAKGIAQYVDTVKLPNE